MGKYLDATGLTYFYNQMKSKFAAASHNHSASNITSGTLPIARGGTGQTSAAAALQKLGGISSVNNTKPDSAGNVNVEIIGNASQCDVITSSQTFTTPKKSNYKFTIKGGGGGGANNGYGNLGGGGGEGGTTIAYITLDANVSVYIIIGGGGTAGSASAGGDGGDSKITVNGNTYTAGGGKGGNGNYGGAGGTGTVNGCCGTNPSWGNLAMCGVGGGAGGASKGDAVANSGGGGAGYDVNSVTKAGNGGAGFVMIEY